MQVRLDDSEDVVCLWVMAPGALKTLLGSPPQWSMLFILSSTCATRHVDSPIPDLPGPSRPLGELILGHWEGPGINVPRKKERNLPCSDSRSHTHQPENRQKTPAK